MSSADERQALYEYIKQQFNDMDWVEWVYELEDADQEVDSLLEFKNMEEFLQHQKTCLDELSDDKVTELMSLRDLIQSGIFYGWEHTACYRFCFSLEKEIVLLN